MSKEKSNKAFHLLEERGCVEKETNKEQCFVKTTDMGQFCFLMIATKSLSLSSMLKAILILF